MGAGGPLCFPDHDVPPTAYLALVRAAFVALVASVAVLLPQAAGAAKTPTRVTFVGDSVPASINYSTTAQTELDHGLNVQFDLKVCRRLVQTSCPYQGVTPTTALQAVRAYGRSLGKVLIVDVGYNESSEGYADGIDEIMHAALAQGAVGVVWVTLRETRDIYHWTNIAIKTAKKRWPQLSVADWNSYSAGKPWFGDDGLHLDESGAEGLATLLRPYVLRAARGIPPWKSGSLFDHR